nr:MAG TPA: Exonuclease VII, large subunit [Caudoviricetes sp.]
MSPILERVEDTITEFYALADVICWRWNSRSMGVPPISGIGHFAFCRQPKLRM